MEGPGEYLTLDELCELYRLTPKTVYQQRWRRHAPGSLGVNVGRKLLFRRRDLEAWFDSEQRLAAEAV